MTVRAAPSPQARGLPRDPPALRHPLVGHDVQRPAADARLGRLLRRTPARHAIPEDRLHAGHRRLRQRSLMVARLLLPGRPTDPADAAEVLIPGEPRAGRLAM